MFSEEWVLCSVNVIGPHLIGSGTLRRWRFHWNGYGLVEGSMPLWGWALRLPLLRIPPHVSVYFLWVASTSACTPPCYPP